MVSEKRESYITGEKSITPEQAKKLIAHTTDRGDEMVLRVALGTGMRRKDLVGIEWSHVDLYNRKIEYWEDKKDDWHDVIISPELRNHLVKWKNRLKERFDGVPKYVFPKRRGQKKSRKHMSGRNVHNILNRNLRKAGVLDEDEEKPVHALRATYIKMELDRVEEKTGSQRKAENHVAKQVNDKVETIRQYYTVPSDTERKAMTK